MFEALGVFYRGMVLGLMISAPVGPIGLLCIRRTAQKGLAIGFATGMGAASADACFGALAAFGVAAILSLIAGLQTEIRIVGGVLLAVMAWNAWHKHPALGNTQDISVGNILKAYISGLGLTCTNPVTILAVLAVVATLGGQMDRYEATLLTIGVFAGASGWWIMLSGGVALFRHHFTERTILMINRGTAVLLLCIALYATGTGAFKWLQLHEHSQLGVAPAPSLAIQLDALH